MTLSAPISPFAKPVPPPRPIVVLLYATDLFLNNSTPVLAHEDLRPRPVERSLTRFHPYNCRDVNRQLSSQSPADPVAPCSPSHVATVDPPLPFVSDSSSLNCPTSFSQSPEGEEDTRVASVGVPREVPFTPQAVATKLKIARPIGAGRKNLSGLVKWKQEFYNAVQKRARELIYKDLQPSLCFSDQDQSDVDKVKTKMISEFPDLDNYENEWPLDNILITLLKYSSSKSRRHLMKKTMEAVQDSLTQPIVTKRQVRSASRRCGGLLATCKP